LSVELDKKTLSIVKKCCADVSVKLATIFKAHGKEFNTDAEFVEEIERIVETIPADK
jgi:hypothetical protein